MKPETIRRLERVARTVEESAAKNKPIVPLDESDVIYCAKCTRYKCPPIFGEKRMRNRIDVYKFS